MKTTLFVPSFLVVSTVSLLFNPATDCVAQSTSPETERIRKMTQEAVRVSTETAP